MQFGKSLDFILPMNLMRSALFDTSNHIIFRFAKENIYTYMLHAIEGKKVTAVKFQVPSRLFELRLSNVMKYIVEAV